MEPSLLSIRQLAIDFAVESGGFRAVDGLSFDIPRGRTVALVFQKPSTRTRRAGASSR